MEELASREQGGASRDAARWGVTRHEPIFQSTLTPRSTRLWPKWVFQLHSIQLSSCQKNPKSKPKTLSRCRKCVKSRNKE